MTELVPETESDSHEPQLQFVASPGFTGWLAEQHVSIALTSYRSGKLFLIGHNLDGRISIFERTFSRCMGMWTDAQTLWVASLFEIHRFENILPRGGSHEGYDRCYVPRQAFVTGDLNVHDIAINAHGQLVFVNTLFNCLASVSETHSFDPLWQPPFIETLTAEDRCHLNGMALERGVPRYVSMFAATNEAQGWRQQRLSGGRVLDLRDDTVIVDGLAMPHSPRLYRDRLWLLQSGTGEFGYVDRHQNCFVPLTFCPGYVRGLEFVGDYAVVGLSKGREENLFQELPLHERLEQSGQSVRCGVCVIDLRTCEVVHTLWIEGVVTQLYDIAVLPGVVRPMAVGFKTDEIQRMISVGPKRSLA
ncbi:MAG: TIGR03032 family protein [Planctomycetaceae bacterium]